MKKITTYILFALFSFAIVLNVNAQKSIESSKVSEESSKEIAKHRIDIRVSPDNQVVLRADVFEDVKRLNYILNVRSESGDIVYASSFLKKGPILKSYDLSSLPQGKYTFTVLKKLKPIYSKTVLKNESFDANSANEPLLVEAL